MTSVDGGRYFLLAAVDDDPDVDEPDELGALVVEFDDEVPPDDPSDDPLDDEPLDDAPLDDAPTVAGVRAGVDPSWAVRPARESVR